MLANQRIKPSPDQVRADRNEAAAVGRQGAGETGGSPTRMPPDNARYLEIVLCRFRYAVAALAVMMVMVATRRPFSPITVLVITLFPVAVHIGVRMALRQADNLTAARRIGRWVLAVDAAVALGTYLAYLRDPVAIPAAFMPLLVLELAVRFDGRRATAAAMAVFATAVGVRVFFQVRVIPGGALRWPLLLVWVLLATLILVLSRELQAQARMRLAAQEDRARIAKSFQVVIGEVLTRSGVPPSAATWEDVLNAVRLVCDEQPAECAVLAASIADLLVPVAREFGLTRREREVVRLLAMGYSYDRIARSLFVSGSTVRNHTHNVRSKLGLSSREEVVAFARKQGLAPQGQVTL